MNCVPKTILTIYRSIFEDPRAPWRVDQSSVFDGDTHVFIWQWAVVANRPARTCLGQIALTTKSRTTLCTLGTICHPLLMTDHRMADVRPGRLLSRSQAIGFRRGCY